LPNSKRRELVFAIFHDSKRDAYSAEPEGPVAEDAASSFSDGRISFELIMPSGSGGAGLPARIWRLTYAGRDAFQL